MISFLNIAGIVLTVLKYCNQNQHLFQISCILMTTREATTMGDVLATEANLLGMIKEVYSIFLNKTFSKLQRSRSGFVCTHYALIMSFVCASTLSLRSLMKRFTFLKKSAKTKESLSQNLKEALSETQSLTPFR